MEELLADLKDRTGLDIKRVSVGKINFLKDTAELTLYYDGGSTESCNGHDQPVIIAYNSADLDD